MRGRRRFVILAATALAFYGLAAWLFLLPSIQLPLAAVVRHLPRPGRPAAPGCGRADPLRSPRGGAGASGARSVRTRGCLLRSPRRQLGAAGASLLARPGSPHVRLRSEHTHDAARARAVSRPRPQPPAQAARDLLCAAGRAPDAQGRDPGGLPQRRPLGRGNSRRGSGVVLVFRRTTRGVGRGAGAAPGCDPSQPRAARPGPLGLGRSHPGTGANLSAAAEAKR